MLPETDTTSSQSEIMTGAKPTVTSPQSESTSATADNGFQTEASTMVPMSKTDVHSLKLKSQKLVLQ